MISTQRLWLTADRQSVVGDGDERAAYLLTGVGGMLDPETIRRFALQTDGSCVIGPTVAPERVSAAGPVETHRKDVDAPQATQSVAGPKRTPSPRKRTR